MGLKRRKLEVQPPYVSMADIAFNLVLFFLILAKVQEEKPIPWEPAEGSNVVTITNAKIVVAVGQDGKIYLNGTEIGVGDLAASVGVKLAENPSSKVVLLKIHKETQAAIFNKIMEAVSEAGGDVFHVLNEEKS